MVAGGIGGGRRVADYGVRQGCWSGLMPLIPGRYMWGSDNPYMSWCDEEMAYVRSYGDEAKVLWALPEAVRMRMAHSAPRRWLGIDGELV